MVAAYIFVSIWIWRWSKDSILDGLNVIEPTNQWRIICYFMLLLGFDWCNRRSAWGFHECYRCATVFPGMFREMIGFQSPRWWRTLMRFSQVHLWSPQSFLCNPSLEPGSRSRVSRVSRAWFCQFRAQETDVDCRMINSRQKKLSPLMCEAWFATGHDLRVRSPKVQQNFCGVWFCCAIHLDSPPWWYSMPFHAHPCPIICYVHE